MKAGECRSDVESELTSDNPTDLDNMVFSDKDKSQEVVVTSVVHHDPVATSVGEEQEAAWRVEVPASWKRAASVDAIGERVLKRMRSPRPSVVPPVPSPPAADAAGRAERFEERTGARVVTGSVPMPDS